MKIKKISISGLFNKYNHFISLNEDDPITIIIGPNGYGKTTILRLLNDFFEGNYFGFSTPPFHIFEIIFDEDVSLRIYNNFYILANQCLCDERYDILLNQGDLYNDERIFFEYDDLKNPKNWEVYAFDKTGFKKLLMTKRKKNIQPIVKIKEEIEENVRKLNYLKEYSGHSKVKKIGGFDKLTDDDKKAIKELYDLIVLQGKTYQSSRNIIEGDPEKIQDEPTLLKEIREKIPVHLIGSQRIINPHDLKGSTSKSQNKIFDCCSDLVKKIQNADTSYFGKSLELDQTFAKRVVENFIELKSKHIDNTYLSNSKETVISILKLLKDKKFDYSMLGLMTQDRTYSYEESSSIDLDKINEIEDIDFQTLNALGLYCYDSLEKLKVYNDLATKLELFKKIMENLGITNFIFTKENGLEFMSNLTTDLSPDELSSGEQQAVILYYFLIFQVTPNSYILIDEPEISWHISWQRLFIPNLLEILKVVPLHFLIATHSPSIIHDRWDLTVELQGEPSWP